MNVGGAEERLAGIDAQLSGLTFCWPRLRGVRQCR